MSTEILYKEESYQIMGAAFDVYKEIGCGFLEAVYQECLAIELEDRKIKFEEQKQLKLQYKNRQLRQKYEPDFLCYGKIVVEIIACNNLRDEHRMQVINYLKATGMELALLINFGHFPKVEHERFLNQNQSFSRVSRLS